MSPKVKTSGYVEIQQIKTQSSQSLIKTLRTLRKS